MTQHPQHEPDFIELLTELSGYQDYFKDHKKVAQLADWLKETTGLNPLAAKLAIRHLAPFVIARLSAGAKQAGEALAESWQAKLNDRLSHYAWYRTLAQRLLNILKTRTDRSYAEAIETGELVKLEELITDPARRSNLTSEQQGLIQLLIGQQENTEQSRILLDSLLNRLRFQFNLLTPEQIEEETHKPIHHPSGTDGKPQPSVQWLTYHHRQATLVARDTQLRQLSAFFNQPAPLSWCAITGPGGVGKSRLALDAAIEQQHLWDIGFVDKRQLHNDDLLQHWHPLRPTALIIDYAGEDIAPICALLDRLIHHTKDPALPVRVIILERYYQGQDWWSELTSATTAGNERLGYLFQRQAMELDPLGVEHSRQVLGHFLQDLDSHPPLPTPEDPVWEQLHKLTDSGRPLFIGMAAVAIADRGIKALRDWRKDDLLNFILKHEYRIWARQLGPLWSEKKDALRNLMALNAFLGGNLDLDPLLNMGLADSEDTLYRLWEALCQVTGNPRGWLQPDLFAEYAVLQHWDAAQQGPSPKKTRIKRRLLAALQQDPDSTRDFLTRCATDFAQDTSAFAWWELVADHLDSAVDTEQTDASPSTQLAFEIIGQLTLAGKYTQIQAIWLPPLLTAMHPKSRARALNMQGKTLLHLGDYDTALDYLKQSLSIRQDIGDTAGACATRFNLGHLHLEREEMEQALALWVQVYDLAWPMRLAQVLEALTGLSAQLGLADLGLPTGLEGWAELSRRFKAKQAETE